MDPLQQKALNALESFILLSKSATSPRAAADLISQATSAPNTYVFAELLQTPNIQALRTAAPEYARYITLLEIFVWGTWSDYASTPNLPSLSDAQALKLRQLSVVTFAASPQTLTYAHLLTALSLPSVRSLEDLIISSIYAGLLNAKLDTLQSRVDVSSVAPLRDLRPKSIPRMVAVLDDWDARCVSVLADIENQIRGVRRGAGEVWRREMENEKAVEKAMGEKAMGEKAMGEKEEKGKVAGKRGARDKEGDGEWGDEMDVDEGAGRGRARGAKRGGGGGRFAGFAKKLGG